MCERLLDACAIDWSGISPAIFGALFQSIMKADARRNLGAHYTSEENIQKLIKPLFLDELRAEFERIKGAFPGSSLADLYDPLSMPPLLLKAHQKLDAAVDAAYGRKGFKSDAERVAFLFERYQRATSLQPPVPAAKPRRITRRAASAA
jgi:hypothetical protein